MDDIALELTLNIEKEYLSGLPMWVEVTLANHEKGSEYYHLPNCDPFAPPYPFIFKFTRGKTSIELPYRPEDRESNYETGFSLGYDEQRTFLLDLSELAPEIDEGIWQMNAQLVGQGPVSANQSVTLIQSDPKDREIVHRLRSRNDRNEPSWSAFLLENPRTILPEETETLSGQAKRLVDPYLYLHRAFYGPALPQDLSLHEIDVLAQEMWEGEFSLIRYEVLWAMGAYQAGIEALEIEAKWPGLRWRLDEIGQGEGVLHLYRDYVQQYIPPLSKPYMK